jgi:amino acid adenylation domain-containing protein
LFEEQAARVPENPAVLWGGQALSYAELDDYSSRVAAFLRSSGVEKGGVVALLLERCREMLPLMLGIMKAGCAYTPLLPSLPKERIAFMLRDSGAQLVFAQAEHRSLLPQGTLSVAAEDIWSLPRARDFLSADDAELPAYVLYTSGSTGRPKGVRIQQKSLCNRLLWMQDYFRLTENERLIQKTSIGFDVSLWELFWPFIVGAALRVPEPGAEKDPWRLFKILQEDGTSTIHFVPSMLSVFLDAWSREKPPLPLKRVIVSGEALTPALSSRFYELFGKSAELTNLYGPTECTVDVLYYPCGAGDEEIPIGRAVWNTGAYILDENGAELPQGETGELCISGIQLAQGYTDEKQNLGRFEEHPEYGRLYRTGDLASVRGDGEILYHGRRDNQVKIRGQRVELGEIESVLAAVEGVDQAAVLWDGHRLTGFYKTSLPLKSSYILNHLAQRLPEHMLPERLFALEEFPINANGKLDRKALAEHIPREAAAEPKKLTPPRTDAERQLLEILASSFNRRAVDILDKPASLGLDSLELVRLVALLEERGLRVSVNDCYTAPTLRALAAGVAEGEKPLLMPLFEGGGEAAVVGIPYGGGGFGTYGALARELGMPFYAAQSARVQPKEIYDIIKKLPHKRWAVLGCCIGSICALELAKMLEDNEGELAAVFLLSAAPDKRKKSPWRHMPDFLIRLWLRGLSGQAFSLSKAELQGFRADAEFFFAKQEELRSKGGLGLKAPLYLLYGESDPLVKNRRLGEAWAELLGVAPVAEAIPGGMHYLTQTHPQAVAQWLRAAL